MKSLTEHNKTEERSEISILKFKKHDDVTNVKQKDCYLNERPYVCKFAGCDKRFKLLSHLKEHIRTHTGMVIFYGFIYIFKNKVILT